MMQDKIQRLHGKLGASPLISFLMGGLVLVLWAGGTVVQIQTSEYLALGGERVSSIAWGVLMQPWLLLIGQAPLQLQTAWLYGWVVEAITLVFSLSLAVAVHKINAVNVHLGKGFVVGGLLLIVLNSWADYSSAPGNSPIVQGLVALAIGGIVVVGMPLGIGLIEHGFEEL